jgi:hypothetical protein
MHIILDVLVLLVEVDAIPEKLSLCCSSSKLTRRETGTASACRGACT